MATANEEKADVIVRKWVLEDLPTIYVLCKEFEKTQGMDVRSLSEKTLAKDGFGEWPWYHGWLAETTSHGNNIIIGFALVVFCYDMGRALRLECLYTDPAWRQLGVAKRLIRAVVTFGLENECESMNWVSQKDNTPANNFYENISEGKGVVSECYVRCKGGKLSKLK